MRNTGYVPDQIHNLVTNELADVIEVIVNGPQEWHSFVVQYADGSTEIKSSEGLWV